MCEARAAACGSCVTMMMVLPCRSLSACSRFRTSSPDLRSRSPVGSSQSSSVGSETIARAMPTRCSWPPESSRGLCFARSLQAHEARAPRRRACAARLRESRVSSSGSSTLRSAREHGQQVVHLEDEADVVRAPARERAVAHRCRCAGRRPRSRRCSAGRGRRSGSAASTCRSPTAPSARGSRPARMSRSSACSTCTVSTPRL